MRGLTRRERPRGRPLEALLSALVFVAVLLGSGGLEVETHEDPTGTPTNHQQHSASAYRLALLDIFESHDAGSGFTLEHHLGCTGCSAVAVTGIATKKEQLSPITVATPLRAGAALVANQYRMEPLPEPPR